MSLIVPALAWYGVVAVGGLAGCGALRRAGCDALASATLGRLAGWCLAGYAGWLVGWLGWPSWWLVAAGAIVVLLALALPGLRGLGGRDALASELVGVAAFIAVAILRLPVMNVSGTEKPMDLAILATLLRPGTVPPADPWLAGTSLPYYYWGFVPWLAPMHVLRLAPDAAFNLLVPLIAAVTAQAAWGLARRLGAPPAWAWVAPFVAVLGGTPDGWRQLLAGQHVGGLDLWASSRQIGGAITEFPLFTFHLGDLHPHLLSLPLALGALLAASVAGGGRRLAWPLTALLFGAASAANPWNALPVGAGVAAMLLAPERDFRPPWRGGLKRWGAAALVGALGWLLFAPFWLAYHPPYHGLGLVSTPTRWDELALFAGGVLAVPIGVGWELSWRWGGVSRASRQLMRAFWLAAGVVVAALSGSVALALAVSLGGLLAAQVARAGPRPSRPAWALGLIPLGLLGGMDLAFLRDPYGESLYRMNTVFKASFLAFALLAVLGPVWSAWLARRRRVLATVLLSVVVAAGLPQLADVTLRVGPPPGPGWGGLAWMARGDAEGVRWLRSRPSGEVLIEAVGEAYSDAARLSAASGVPAVLGWENHELVWRGAVVSPELGRRRRLVDELYRCADPARVRELAGVLGATLIAVGSVEERLYPTPGLEAVVDAGRPAFAAPGLVLVRVGG